MLESLDLHEDEKEQKITIRMSVRLAPFDAGIAQIAEVRLFWSKEVKKYTCEIYVRRTSGLSSIWEAANRKFFDEIRKQALLWKVLRPHEKEKYYD